MGNHGDFYHFFGRSPHMRLTIGGKKKLTSDDEKSLRAILHNRFWNGFIKRLHVVGCRSINREVELCFLGYILLTCCPDRKSSSSRIGKSRTSRIPYSRDGSIREVDTSIRSDKKNCTTLYDDFERKTRRRRASKFLPQEKAKLKQSEEV